MCGKEQSIGQLGRKWVETKHPPSTQSRVKEGPEAEPRGRESSFYKTTTQLCWKRAVASHLMMCGEQEAKTQVSPHLVPCIYQVGQHVVESEQSERAHSKRERTLSLTGKSWSRIGSWVQNTVDSEDCCGPKCPLMLAKIRNPEQERCVLSVCVQKRRIQGRMNKCVTCVNLTRKT